MSSWNLTVVLSAAVPLGIVMLVGLFGNLMVVFISCKGKVRTKGRALIASLALADSLESLNLILMLVSAVNFGRWVFSHELCQLNGFLTTEFVAVSMLNLAAISVNRFFIVVKRHLYDQICNQRNQAILIACIWTIPLILAVSPLLGWSSYQYQPGKCLCIFFFSESLSYSTVLLLIVVPVPLVTICYCCWKIFQRVRQHSMRINNEAVQHGFMRGNVEEVNITKTLVVVIAAYLVCFIPAATVNLVEMLNPNYKIPLWIDLLSMILVFCNHANNPLIYGVLNRQYRKAFLEILTMKFGRCRPATRVDIESIHSNVFLVSARPRGTSDIRSAMATSP